jgi:hypothetical protein
MARTIASRALLRTKLSRALSACAVHADLVSVAPQVPGSFVQTKPRINSRVHAPKSLRDRKALLAFEANEKATPRLDDISISNVHTSFDSNLTGCPITFI